MRSNDLDADAEAEADLDAFVDAVAETAAETDETFFRVAAAVVDAAIRAEEEKEEAEEEEAFEERRLTTRAATRTTGAECSGVGRRASGRVQADVDDEAFETSPDEEAADEAPRAASEPLISDPPSTPTSEAPARRRSL